MPDELDVIISKLQDYENYGQPDIRLKLSRRALDILEHTDANSELLGQLQLVVGNALFGSIHYDQTAKYEEAIKAYQHALDKFPKAENPQMWARIMNDLGAAYYARKSGNRSENFHNAIQAYEASLEVRTKEADIYEWASTVSNYALVLANHPAAFEPGIIQKAINMLRTVTDNTDVQQSRQHWANALNNLGILYQSKKDGDIAQNLADAITCYETLLTIFDEGNNSNDWARTHHNLGSIYNSLTIGNPVENIDKAISHFEQALTVRTLLINPDEWGITMNNLGMAYTKRSTGNTKNNIEEAIKILRQAHEVRTRDADPYGWAETADNLAKAYFNRIEGHRAENLEVAIELFNDALQIRTPQNGLNSWRITMSNLASTYQERIYGEVADNIERAIELHKEALSKFVPESDANGWAATANSLSVALIKRVMNKHNDNVKEAILLLEKALAFLSPESNLVRWSQTHNNLGLAYYESGIGDRHDNLKRAIEHFEHALEARTLDTNPFQWALTTENLGNCYRELAQYNAPQLIEKALRYQEATLQVYTKKTYPLEWAHAMHNLGVTYALSARTRTDKAQRVVRCFEAALTIRQRDTLPADHLNTLQSLGNFYFNRGNWVAAHHTYTKAIAVSQDLLASAYTVTGRQDSVGTSTTYYTNNAYCLVMLGEYDKAFESLEAGKTQLLVQTLKIADENLPPITEEDLSTLTRIRQNIRTLERTFRNQLALDETLRDKTVRVQLSHERQQLMHLLDRIQQQYPNWLPQQQTADNLLRMIPENSAIVAPIITSEGSVVFLIPHGIQQLSTDHIIPMPSFSISDTNQLLQSAEKFGWLDIYQPQNMAPFIRQINGFLLRLWRKFVGKIHDHAHKLSVNKLIIIPSAGLGLLPLHAAYTDKNGKRYYLIDSFAVSYCSSMFMVERSTKRTRRRTSDVALIGAITTYNDLPPLHNAQGEAKIVAQILKSTVLESSAITKENLLSLATEAGYIHLACHGSFAWWDDPMSSALWLHNDESLTLNDILTDLRLKQSPLVVLSACETGISDVTNIPEEFIGLPTGFFEVGAANVISSLWSVSDASTSLLMARFYENLLNEESPMEPAEALKEAQIWLRDSKQATLEAVRFRFSHPGDMLVSSGTKYESPFYWAPFFLYGV